ncbi:hypothetical protein [Alienimonas sp. DA493]|uniref:hypothetical protein n=1 Tax=Alienimonas sp. DA493 TaxID=3373605 RepID=UPI003754518A
MPDPPPLAALLAAAANAAEPAAPPTSGPWANDLFPAVLLLALGAALVAVGAWIAKPPPRPPQPPAPPRPPEVIYRPPRRRGGRRNGRGHDRPPGPANYQSPPPDPLRRPLRLP